jgi:hypothetical protein
MRGLLLCRPITGPQTNRCKAIAVNLALLFSQLIIQQSSTLTTRYKTADEGFEVRHLAGATWWKEDSGGPRNLPMETTSELATNLDQYH